MLATESPPIFAAEQPSAQPSCLYCGGENLSPHFQNITDRLRFAPGQWAFERCGDCDSLLLAPFPAAEEIAAFYPPVYSFAPDMQPGGVRRVLNWLEHKLYYGPQYRAQARAILRGIGWRGQRGLNLLDVGCGRGLRLTAFRDRGFRVQGLDLQPEVVQYVRDRLGIEAKVGGIESLATEFEPQSFDAITAFYLLEHVPDVGEVLARCRELLRPGGWFVGVVPVCDGLQARLLGRRWLHVTEAPRHLSLPSRAGLLQAARRAGYTQARLASDSAVHSAGIVGGSLFPGSDLTSTYGGRRWLLPALRRIAGGCCAVAAMPLCWAEQQLLGQTSHGMLIARNGN